MCYSSSGYRFLCASHPGYVVCSVFPAAVPTTAAEDFQTRVVGAFTEHVRGELGACDAATLGAVTKSYRFVRFGESGSPAAPRAQPRGLVQRPLPP